MKRVADREGRGNQQQNGQQPAERRSRHALEAGKYSSQLHDDFCNRAHGSFMRKQDFCQEPPAKALRRSWLPGTSEEPLVTEWM